MLGGSKRYIAVPWFWSDQYDLSLQIAGMPSDGIETVRRQISEHAFIIFHCEANGRLVGASAIGPGNSIARDVKLAEMLIARGISPAAEALADPAVALKALLKGEAAGIGIVDCRTTRSTGHISAGSGSLG